MKLPKEGKKKKKNNTFITTLLSFCKLFSLHQKEKLEKNSLKDRSSAFTWRSCGGENGKEEEEREHESGRVGAV